MKRVPGMPRSSKPRSSRNNKVAAPTKRAPTPIMDTCDECHGVGEVQQHCEDCGGALVSDNWATDSGGYICTECFAKESDS